MNHSFLKITCKSLITLDYDQVLDSVFFVAHFLTVITGFVFLLGNDRLQASVIGAHAPQFQSQKSIICGSFCQ